MDLVVSIVLLEEGTDFKAFNKKMTYSTPSKYTRLGGVCFKTEKNGGKKGSWLWRFQSK